MKPSFVTRARLPFSAAFLGAALTPTLFAAIDGNDDGGEGYVSLATQAHAPGFGSTNFLGNISAVQSGNNLNLFMGGLVTDNSIILFIDSKPGGINSISGSTITSGGEEDGINNLNGLTFESGFDADFAVRIYGNGANDGAFHNVFDLSTGVREYAGNPFTDAMPLAPGIQIIAEFGTIWSPIPTPQTDADDGLEFAFDLAALGVPTGLQDVKLLAFITNSGSTFLSDSVLGPLDAAGNLGAPSGVNFETETGTQTLTVSVTAANNDNDGDGLLNTVETNNGPDSYNGPTDTGTDPDDADTDDDLLDDGDEVNVHGTDPTKPDTDDDGANDATELSLMSDPSNGPIPDGGDTAQIGYDFFDYADGGIDGATGFETRVFDHDNDTNTDAFTGHTGAVAPWSTSFGTEIICGKLATSNGGIASRNFNGAATGGTTNGRVENIASSSAKVVYAKATIHRNSGTTYGGLSFLKDGVEVAFAGVRDALNGPDRNFGVEINGEAGADFSGDIPADRTTYCVVAKLDTVNETIEIWVDPTLGGAEPASDAEATFVDGSNAVASGIRLGSGGTGQTLWDDLVVTTSWAALDTVMPTDMEADGLRDSWENLFFPGDLDELESGFSWDGDDLNDDEEQAIGSNPTEEDTDDDGLEDDQETNTGIFVNSDDTGSDPCNADTDGDTLSDGDEVDTHSTNPNLADTDGDLENDGFEVFQGTDPKVGGEASNSTALGLVQVNGTRDSFYGSPIAVQTVQTQFGDNQSELNAGYATVQDGKLYLLLTGNLQDNFNKLEIFIDSKAGGQSTFDSAPNDGSDSMDGMIFDTGFEADYHLIVRRGDGKFDLDFADLGTQTFNFYEDILSFGIDGFGSTGTGVNPNPIRVGYDGSNTAGVGEGTGAADQVAAAAVDTGLEICIDLGDLGSPTDTLRVMAIINNESHGFFSNQSLGGLPAGTENLGVPNPDEEDPIDFTLIAEDQFFTVSLVEPNPDFAITNIQLISGGTELQLTISGLTNGNNYSLRESVDLNGFGAVTTSVAAPGADFTATGTSQVLVVDRPAGPVRFYLAEDAP
ncbi:hypothetical protein [Haloferula sp.]|uniref:hypothetical protein n=1 Tax=Haloferula sp. TaxID=2497595 RepID=UPI00329A876B